MTDSSAKANILPGLKQIGLIDADGKTNSEIARKFRDDSEYPSLCRELIEKIYPQELRDAFPDKSADREKIKKWFKGHTGVGDSMAGKVSAFYSLLNDGNPMPVVSTSSTKSESKQLKPAASKNKPVIKEKATISSYQQTDPDVNQNSARHAPEVNINLQIHISSDASPDQIKSIFENMAIYLYNKPNQP
jgi:hypothetical protein